MIITLGIIVILAQSTPTNPPMAPMHANQAPVATRPAPFAIPTIAGIDRIFALAAIQGNNAELDMAHLALGRASISDVKAFAQKMLTEHMGIAADMLPQLRRVLGALPSERLAAADQLALAHLRTISDVDFDQVYALAQVGDHLSTLTAFETEADNGTDAQLKSLARKWLPTIQSHLELAVSLTQHIGGASPLRMH